MKKYHIKQPYSDDNRCFLIVNDDEEPIIKEIECGHTEAAGDERRWDVKIEFENGEETEEVRQKFLNVTGADDRFAMGIEILTLQKDMKNILKYFKLIQEVDPLPLSVFSEIMALMDFDLSEFLYHGLIKEKVTQSRHPDALELALEADSKGCHEALALLANLYEEKSDRANYLNVLEHLPKTHKFYKEANEILHQHELSKTKPETEEENYTLLERKLRFSLNAGLKGEASCYFDELSGNTGLNPEVKDVEGHPDTLIKIAKVQRERKEELENLREMVKKQSESLQSNKGFENQKKEIEPTSSRFFKP